jgi:CMP-N,N'-diacetyllegionaminic acid synthase
MIANQTVLALIPARGGSKGIPGKNIIDLCGKPLIAWTIESAKKSKYIDRVLVTTDSQRIADISREFGANVPFLRPAELATDTSPGDEAIFHALDLLRDNENKKYDIVCCLQPTSPLRNEKHIDEALDEFLNVENSLSLISVCEAESNPYWMKVMDEKGYLKPFIETEKKFINRQDLPKVYQLNGAIYLIRTDDFYRLKTFDTERTTYYLMDRESSIDIDEPLDLEFAKFLMQRRK